MKTPLLTIKAWHRLDEQTRVRWNDLLEHLGILPAFTYQVDLNPFSGDFVARQYHQLPGVGPHLRSKCHWWARWLPRAVCETTLTIPNRGRIPAIR
jgi:hypothetical protein